MNIWSSKRFPYASHVQKMGGSAFILYTVLIYCCDDRGIVSYSLKDLAEDTGLSHVTVIKAIRKLIDLGYIEKFQSGSIEGDCNVYRITKSFERGAA